MNYKQILKYLDALGEPRMRLDLAPTQKMLEILGNPDRNLRSVIVSGTNGKGSACAFLTSIARIAGLRVGTFTSPHLSSPTERIALDGSPIQPDMFARLGTELIGAFDRGETGTVTYFEFLTIMAVQTFVHQRVDLAIFEVGLGGRLDSTNALERAGTITTSIGHDHTSILGETLSQIAREKGAIMREGLPAVVAEQPEEVRETLISCAQESGARLILQGRDYEVHRENHHFSFVEGPLTVGPLSLGLRGGHQVANAGAAVAMARELSIPQDAIAEGLASALHPGRLERWATKEKKEAWLDVAHNRPAAREIALFFAKEKLAPVDLVIGVLKDKDWKGMLEELLPIAKSVTLCRPNSPRAWEPNEAREMAVKILPGLRSVEVVEDPREALERTLAKSKRVLVTGSFFTVGAVREALPAIAKLS